MNKKKSKQKESIFEDEIVVRNNKQYLILKEEPKDYKQYLLIDFEVFPIFGILFLLFVWLAFAHYFTAN